MSDDDKKYEVGHGKPPRKHQFKPGQSGNKAGRPKGSKNFQTDVCDTLKMPVPVSENGQRKMVTTQKAALMRLREKALKGDNKAMDRLLALAQAYNGEDLAADSQAELPESDRAILDRFMTRHTAGEEPEDE